ncbi:hypothetical protein NYO99_11845 [Pelomonas sp. UHG3]|uniref:Uncharacterized protein n=1 Tax=Roseateles hydrophilus TaxID=2975054 RepID=A0ACC6CB99_9BURK|nr:hypothetical protein [Pelomonas sp. UHG3]MCY4745667.1 hypothetical protein [Pelomonas sp. UHG3]
MEAHFANPVLVVTFTFELCEVNRVPEPFSPALIAVAGLTAAWGRRAARRPAEAQQFAAGQSNR